MLLHRLKNSLPHSPANFVIKKIQELPLAAPSASAAPWQHSLSLCLTFDTDRSSSDLFKLNSAGGTGIYNYRRIYFHRWSCSQLMRCSGYYARQNWAFTSCSHLTQTGSAGDQSRWVVGNGDWQLEITTG